MSAYAAAVSKARDNSRFAKASPIEGAMTGGGSGNTAGAIAGLLSGGAKEKKSQLYGEFKHWVWVAISAIATRISGQAYGAGTLVGSKSAELLPLGRKVPRSTLPRSVKELTNGGREIEPFLDHDILDFLATPNGVQGKGEFLFSVVANLLITGEAYIVAGQVKGKDNERGFGVEAWAVPTPWITPKHESGKLFTSFELKVDSQSEPVQLPKEAVCRLYIPDPSDPKGCISPLQTQMPAVKTDAAIQKSQSAMFDQGLWPNVVISIAEQTTPDGKKGPRPVLNGKQRNQIIRAVNQLWKSTNKEGAPAIIDGLIGGIHKLSNTPAEMDWLQSGQQVKTRIFQAFKVNPIICGEIAGVNRAQAAVADQLFCSQAVNPLIDTISCKLLNGFIAGLFDQSETLVLWLEEAAPKDDELLLRQYDIGVRNGAASKNDFRTNILGLPPLPEDDTADASPLLETVGGMTGFVAILGAVGRGEIAPDAAQAAFRLFFRVDDAIASELLGSTGSLGIMAPAPAAGKPKPKPEDEDVDNEEEQDDLPNLDDELGDEAAARVRLKGGLPAISRSAVKASRRTAQLSREKGVAKALLPFSQASIGQRLLSLLAYPPGP